MWTEGTHVGSVEDVTTAKISVCYTLTACGHLRRDDGFRIYRGVSRDVREAVNQIIHICEGPVLAIRAWSPSDAI